MADRGNGWRNGSDPILRPLRALFVLVSLVVAVALALDPNRHDALPTIALFLAVALPLLGYSAVLRWPGRDDREDKP